MDLFQPRMPEVDTPPNIEEVFDKARRTAAGELTLPNNKPSRNVVVVTPGRILMMQPCPQPGLMPASQVASIEKLIPPQVKRNVAAIAFTDLQALRSNLGKAIPFMGILLGLAYIGHSVWVFEGHASALAAGCRDADVLIVDSGMLPFLSKDWAVIALTAMRHKDQIYVHNRDKFGLQKFIAKG